MEDDDKMMLTVITTPIDVDTAAIGTGELSQREAGWIGWRRRTRDDV